MDDRMLEETGEITAEEQATLKRLFGGSYNINLENNKKESTSKQEVEVPVVENLNKTGNTFEETPDETIVLTGVQKVVMEELKNQGIDLNKQTKTAEKANTIENTIGDKNTEIMRIKEAISMYDSEDNPDEVESEIKESKEKKTKKERQKKEAKSNGGNFLKTFAIILCFITLGFIVWLMFQGLHLLKDSTLNKTLSLLVMFSTLTTVLMMFMNMSLICIGTTPRLKRKLSITGVLFCLIGAALGYSEYMVVRGDFIEEDPLLRNMAGKTVEEFIAYANENGIEYEMFEIFNDNLEKDIVLGHSGDIGNKLNLLNERMTVYVTAGVDPNGIVDLVSLKGKTVSEAKLILEELKLSNYKFEFVVDKNSEDIVLSQSVVGNLRRSDALTITASMGMSATEFVVQMPNFEGKTQSEMQKWMKDNSIQYTTKTEKSDTVEKGIILSQSVAEGESVHPGTKGIEIVISSGKEIKTIAFTGKTLEDAKKWISENELKVEVVEEYDDTVAAGVVLGSNKKVGTVMTEGQTIKLTVSKGPLKFEASKTLSEFRTWANKYDVTYKETYQYSDTVKSGGIIKYSHKDGDIVKNNDTITVYVSQGKEVTIPNFNGKTKAEAEALCGTELKCEFEYGGYNSAAKDTVIAQSKTAGLGVVNGTSIKLTLSSGPAQEASLVIQESWLSIGNADRTIDSLRTQLASNYPNITFTFTKRAHNTLNSGMIHPDSSTTTGTKVKQGESYEIIIVE